MSDLNSVLRPYQDWVDFVLAQKDIPHVISTSYGDDEQTGESKKVTFWWGFIETLLLVPQDYAKRVCNSFAQLGARGVSLLFSSGDYGVGDGDSDPATQVCLTNDGKNQTKFIPVFPST